MIHLDLTANDHLRLNCPRADRKFDNQIDKSMQKLGRLKVYILDIKNDK